MRILALDVGDKRIGVAISDELGIAAHGLTVINRNGIEEVIGKILDFIKEYKVEEIVVGLPTMLNGTVGIQGEKVVSFVEEIKKFLNIPVKMFDERLSTKLIEKTLINADVSRAKRKRILDKLSATVILQDYLVNKGRTT